jgi:hypothetical protein
MHIIREMVYAQSFLTVTHCTANYFPLYSSLVVRSAVEIRTKTASYKISASRNTSVVFALSFLVFWILPMKSKHNHCFPFFAWDGNFTTSGVSLNRLASLFFQYCSREQRDMLFLVFLSWTDRCVYSSYRIKEKKYGICCIDVVEREV